jgi:hypothetical protein
MLIQIFFLLQLFKKTAVAFFGVMSTDFKISISPHFYGATPIENEIDKQNLLPFVLACAHSFLQAALPALYVVADAVQWSDRT